MGRNAQVQEDAMTVQEYFVPHKERLTLLVCEWKCYVFAWKTSSDSVGEDEIEEVSVEARSEGDGRKTVPRKHDSQILDRAWTCFCAFG